VRKRAARRLWAAAIEKVRRSPCRVCKTRGRSQAAHIIRRGLADVDRRVIDKDSGRVVTVKEVLPDSVVPLCVECHQLYDDHRLDLLPYLTRDEEIDAVRAVGIARAYKIITGGQG
jgi:hypothetical protein